MTSTDIQIQTHSRVFRESLYMILKVYKKRGIRRHSVARGLVIRIVLDVDHWQLKDRDGAVDNAGRVDLLFSVFLWSDSLDSVDTCI